MSRGRGFWSQQFTDADYLARWKAKCIITDSGCWVFQGFCHPRKGTRHLNYAEASYRGKLVRLNRQVLAIKLGRPLGAGMHACHACDNPPCINPDHLFEADNTANQRDMVVKGRHAKGKKQYCHRGHPLFGDNLREYSDGHRACLTCQRMRQRMKSGWTKEQAESMPVTPFGHRPVNAKRGGFSAGENRK